MDLEVEHGNPNQHRREDLDESEPPVRDEEPHPLEEHGKCTYQKTKRRQHSVAGLRSTRAASTASSSLSRMAETSRDHFSLSDLCPRWFSTRGPTTWAPRPTQVFRSLAFCASNSDWLRAPFSFRSASLASSSTLL